MASRDPFHLSALYAQTRQMEKRVAVAKLELHQQYEMSVKQVVQNAERRIEFIKKMQQNAKQELHNALFVINSNKQWDQFQKYAQQIRKIHLGGSNTSVLPKFKQQCIKSYLSNIQQTKSKCYSILNNFTQQIGSESFHNGRQQSRDLSFNAVTSHSQRMLQRIRTEPSFQISPIKRRQDLTTFVLPQKDNYFTASKPNPISNKQNIKIEQNSLTIDHLPSSRKKMKKQQPKLISSIYPNQFDKKTAQINIISPSSTRQKPKIQQSMPLQQKQTIVQSSVTVRSSISKLQKVKSESRLASPSHKAVLQILQMQQLRFDKLKHGLP